MGAHWAIRLTAGLLATASPHLLGAGPGIEEYQVKAAYLYNFAKFVDWPAAAFGSAASPISICIFGADSFGGALDEVVRGKTAGGRILVVRTLSDLAGAKGCHVLFISAATWKTHRAALGRLAGSGVLTVGEAPGFTAAGGIVGFKLEGRRVRFEINVDAARQAQLQISSKLLNLAEIVKPSE
jgi:hypothetical protein